MSLAKILCVKNNPAIRQGRGPGEVDLHDLYVKEAIQKADQAIEQAKRNGLQQINLIVGKRD